VVVLASIFVLGPVFSSLSLADYFGLPQTWTYLSTALLVVRNELPGVFVDNPYPLAVNGSLWTLPVEFLCYLSVALLGSVKVTQRGFVIAVSLLVFVLLASFAPILSGARFTPHFEMVAVFWWGVFYGYCSTRLPHAVPDRRLILVLGLGFVALLAYSCLGARGFERTAMLVFAAAVVHLALRISSGAKVTDRIGDLSYGMYIFAFPVQQMLAQWGRGLGWGLSVSFCLSLVGTSGFAFASWHLIEKRALLFKPRLRATA
jgi:peptidoglycan/LPS O-acetylase OafA/YrhL